MKKAGKIIVIGIMTIAMTAAVFGCKAQKKTSEENTDTVSEQETESEEGTNEDKEEDLNGKSDQDSVKLAVYEEAFHTAFSLTVGESKQLIVSTDYDGTLEYKSGDEAIATVDKEGNVTAVGPGTVRMTITAGEVEKEVNVTVRASEAESENPEDKENDSREEATGRTGNQTSNTGNNQTAGSSEPAAVNESNTTSISISTIIYNGDGTIVDIPYEQTVEISNNNQEDYHLEWQYDIQE